MMKRYRVFFLIYNLVNTLKEATKIDYDCNEVFIILVLLGNRMLSLFLIDNIERNFKVVLVI